MRATYQKLLILLKADKQKSIVLGALLVLALGFWARAALKSRSSASASAGQTAKATGGSESAEASEPEPRPLAVIALDGPITRNLFVPRPEDFPPPAQTEPTHAEAEKSSPRRDDNTTTQNTLPRLTLEERVRGQARELTLRSTVVGSEPIAVVESTAGGKTVRRVLKMGGVIDGFTLRSVVNRSVVMEKGGVEVTLTIPAN